MEPLLVGAALGAGVGGATSAIGGGNPLQGALMGGLTGAATGGLGGLGGAAGGASGAAGGAAGGAGGAVAQAFPVAAQAPIAATPLAGSAASMASSPLLAEMMAMDAALAATGEGFAKTAGFGLLDAASLDSMLPLASQMMGGGQKQQQAMPAPQMRRAQAPQTQQPIDDLMRMQMMAQRQRRPISLL
jgi:hypothetical protein